MGPLPRCVGQRPGETPGPAVQVSMRVFPELRGAESPVSQMPQQDENEQPSGLRVSNSAQPSTAWWAPREESRHEGPLLEQGVTACPQAGHVELYQYFGLRQDARVLSPSSQTELISNKSLSLSLLRDGDGNWTRTVRGRRRKRAGELLQARGRQPPSSGALR